MYYNFRKMIKNLNEKILGKIKKLRIEKGFTQDFIADKLNITRSAYQKWESGNTYAWAKYLDKLLDIFKMTPKEFFSDIDPKDINQNNFPDITIEYVEKMYQEKCKMYEKLLASKDEQIAFMKDLLDKNRCGFAGG